MRSQGAGDPSCLGRIPRFSVGSAGSFRASPSANPAGRRKRNKALRASALALTIAASLCAAPAAMAQQAPGGVSDTSSIPTPVPATTGGAAYGAPNAATTQVTPTPTATLLPNG